MDEQGRGPDRAIQEFDRPRIGEVHRRVHPVVIAQVPQPSALFEWMAAEGDAEGAALSEMSLEDAVAEMPRVMNAIRRFALTKDSGELFHEAQRRHIAFGEVLTVAQVARGPQYEFRGSFRPVDGFEQVRMPGPLARSTPTYSPSICPLRS